MRFSIIVILIFLSFAAVSQDMEIGVKSGFNFANQPTSPSSSQDYLVGFHGGVYFSKMFNEHSGLQLEALYSVQGHQERDEALALDLVLRNNYINIPLLYRYKLNDKISFFAGPQFGILVRATLTITPSGAGSSSLDVKSEYHAFDWGIGAGGTYELGKNFNLSLRYTHGITSINKNDTDYTAVNTNLQISAGYRLTFKKAS